MPELILTASNATSRGSKMACVSGRVRLGKLRDTSTHATIGDFARHGEVLVVSRSLSNPKWAASGRQIGDPSAVKNGSSGREQVCERLGADVRPREAP